LAKKKGGKKTKKTKKIWTAIASTEAENVEEEKGH
jgi:hypothetical protein